MGFFDSFGAGLSSFGSSIGSAFSSLGSGLLGGLSSFAETPGGSQFLGQVGTLGLTRLADVIGLQQSQGAPARSFGDVSGVPSIGRLNTFVPNSFTLSRPIQEPAADPFFGIARIGRLGPTPVGTAVPALPSSQPIGGRQGILGSPIQQRVGGGPVPAFPISTQMGFPPSPLAGITQALFQGGGGGFQQAGLASSLLRQLPGLAGGLAAGAGIDALTAGGGTPLFRLTTQGARAQFFRTQNPATGQDTWFRPAGRPLLWSGDLTACKRVKKIARRASRKR